jgi:nicotinamide-nucleotide amidase
MNAEIIAVGSELLSYERLDTNSLWLAGKLNELGVELVEKSVQGDDLDRLARAVRDAAGRSDLVILTGGLGPTEDDLTREAVAAATGRPLVFDAEVARTLEERYARLSRRMSENNRRQTFLVQGAEALPNPNGTAAGQWLDHGAAIILLLPGPPGEMKPMVENHVLARLRERLPELHIRTRSFRVAGMPESDLDALISPVYKGVENLVVTVLAKEGDIEIHLRARTSPAEESERIVAAVGARIEELLGHRVYSRDGSPLPVAIGALLRARRATLAVAESCTGGLLGARITEAPGASDYFLGGFQVYGKPMKIRLLGIDPGVVEQYGVVSEAVARGMADSVRDRTQATYALSITGEAGPTSSHPDVPAGTVWIGLATPDKVEAKRFRFPGNRDRVRAFAVQTALNLLRLELLAP